MCGIVGVVNHPKATSVVLQGLKALEYRGYDSAGIYVRDAGVRRAVGRVDNLMAAAQGLSGRDAIGHTRWATHGGVTVANAHPQTSYDQRVTLVHNGVIKNYRELKKELMDCGCTFSSETDTEVLANYMAYLLQRETDIDSVLASVLKRCQGEMAVAAIIADRPGIYYIKRGSPLLLGCRSDRFFVASDLSAVSREADLFAFPEDGEFGYLSTGECYRVNGRHKRPLRFEPYQLETGDCSKSHYEHYMLKEIDEELSLVRRLEKLYVDQGDQLSIDAAVLDALKSSSEVVLLGCGTSYNAIEYHVRSRRDRRITSQVASEFQHPRENACYILVSQSGETYDLIRSLRLIRKTSKTTAIALTNVGYSTLARTCDYALSLAAGPEIAVASTKSYIASMVLLDLLLREFKPKDLKTYFRALRRSIRSALEQKEQIAAIASLFETAQSSYFIGQSGDFALAAEGALKLKEVSYIHAESVLAGELKHGPIATLDTSFPVVAVASTPKLLNRIETNVKEVEARLAPTLVVATTAPSTGVKSLVVKPGPKGLEGIGIATALELLSYYVSRRRGVDIDKPRNLAKSVTVQ